MVNRIRQLQPRPWWFIVAPAVAFVLAELRIVLPLLRGFDHITMAIFVLGNVLVHRLLWFPVGIWGVFVRDPHVFTEYGAIFCYAGWSVYVVLIGAGLQYPRRAIFLVLVLLLILNIAAHQTEHVRAVACPDLMW